MTTAKSKRTIKHKQKATPMKPNNNSFPRSLKAKLKSKLPTKLQNKKVLSLLVFIALFAAVGSYLLIFSKAAGVPIATLEAETLTSPSSGVSVVSDSTASATKALKLTTNSTANGSVTLPTTATSLTVRAKGIQCKGAPQMVFKVDGVQVMSKSVSATSWSEAYTASVNLTAAAHTISVAFTNNNQKGCSRDLLVDKITFFGETITSPVPTVSLTANPTEVSAGSTTTLSWSSTNATSCTAGGGWSGTKATSGTEPTPAITASTTFTLNCSGAGGTAEKSVVVNVTTSHAAGQMFITTAELMKKPISGEGWDILKTKADLTSYGVVDLADQDSYTQTYVLAGALVYARDPAKYASYKDKVISHIKQTCGTEADGPNNLLAVGRTLYGYVVAADLVQMHHSTLCNNGETWGAFLARIRTTVIPGNGRWGTLEFTSADSANNWGAYALPSHLAVSYALNDATAIQRDTDIFKRFLGDTTSPAKPFQPDRAYIYPETTYPPTSRSNGLTWDMSPTLQRGINPSVAGDRRSGAIFEDAMRFTSGGDDSVACCTVQPAGVGYQEESLDGIFSTMQLLRAHGVNLATFQDSAAKRAYDFYMANGGPSSTTSSTKRYLPYFINYMYGTSYPTYLENHQYRHMGYGSWLFTGTP